MSIHAPNPWNKKHSICGRKNGIGLPAFNVERVTCIQCRLIIERRKAKRVRS